MGEAKGKEHGGVRRVVCRRSLVWPPVHEANVEPNARFFPGLRGMHIHNLNHSNTAKGPQLRGLPSPAVLQAGGSFAALSGKTGTLSRLPLLPCLPWPPGPSQSPPLPMGPVGRRRHRGPCPCPALKRASRLAGAFQ